MGVPMCVRVCACVGHAYVCALANNYQHKTTNHHYCSSPWKFAKRSANCLMSDCHSLPACLFAYSWCCACWCSKCACVLFELCCKCGGGGCLRLKRLFNSCCSSSMALVVLVVLMLIASCCCCCCCVVKGSWEVGGSVMSAVAAAIAAACYCCGCCG